MAKRKKRGYKFTVRKQSKLAIGTSCTAGISILILFLFLLESYRTRGNIGVYYGSMGMLALIGTIASFVAALISLKDDKTYKLLPIITSVINGVILFMWGLVYFIGSVVIN